MILLITNQIYFSRHYYADTDKTRIEIERLIKEGECDTKEFSEMQESLLKQLQIKHNLNDNRVILEKVKSNDEKLNKLEKLEEKLEKLDKLEKLEEKLEKLDKLEKLEEKLEKLDKLETLEKSYCEKSEKSDKLEILGKLETLEKSHCEILVKLEKLLERNDAK
ncbi:hypothetical protein RhiirA5_426303 [Rhizophagus irregularis]|uniref:Uncharacterized protein n=1 Tax=Rhizophagus irregularis TaxID=588596 RepID=A0A2N0P4D5_9GLOM|nr:hypothetical protein RhiirA5_426303 [Rhizophagus irregularis]